MTTYLTVCTDINGIRQEFADALGLEDEWEVPYDIKLEIWVEYGGFHNGLEEHSWQTVGEVFYEGKQLEVVDCSPLHQYLCDQLEKENRNYPAL